MGVGRKQMVFILNHFLIFIAWLLGVFAILYFKAYDYVLPAVVTFIVLNASIGIWLRRFCFPIQNTSYRRYMVVQTVFVAIWCPLLAVILWFQRHDVIWLWVIMLLFFYAAAGLHVRACIRGDVKGAAG